jgi:hypothetical protein
MKDALSEPAAGERQDTIGDAFIRWAATGSVAAVTIIAAVISYGHARDLVLRYGVTGRTAYFLPLTVDGLVATCSLILLDCARHDRDAPWQAWVLLFAGACATVAANVAAGLSHGIIGAIIAGWPAVVACGCFELLLRHRRQPPRRQQVLSFEQQPAPPISPPGNNEPVDLTSPLSEAKETGNGQPTDPAVNRARSHYAAAMAAGSTPSIRAIKRELHVGTAKASAIRAALADELPGECRAA